MRFFSIFCFFMLSFGLCQANTLTLKEKFFEAVPGSYVVLEQNKTYTFLHVFEKSSDRIVLEEVVVPASRFFRTQMSWKDWFERGGPGHTAWTMTQINLNTGQLEEIYSFVHHGWIETAKADNFISTLMNLPFKEVPTHQRKRVGPTPLPGRTDHRLLWNPRMIVNGCVVTNVPFSVWRGRWPSDGSEISHKMIEIYIPENASSPENTFYPTYFPYWLEVEGKIGGAKVRVVDSGLNALSPMPRMPHRPPQLMNNGVFSPEGLAFEVSAPPHFKEFMVIAEEVDAPLGNTIVLPAEVIVSKEQDELTVFVNKDFLEQALTPGEPYLFSLSPKEDPTLNIEIPSPLVYR